MSGRVLFFLKYHKIYDHKHNGRNCLMCMHHFKLRIADLMIIFLSCLRIYMKFFFQNQLKVSPKRAICNKPVYGLLYLTFFLIRRIYIFEFVLEEENEKLRLITDSIGNFLTIHYRFKQLTQPMI